MTHWTQQTVGRGPANAAVMVEFTDCGNPRRKQVIVSDVACREDTEIARAAVHVVEGWRGAGDPRAVQILRHGETVWRDIPQERIVQ